tara:strand:+ start:5970 stop:6455 length:486 start_codon:yes stop_codon:yes gene_type:complete
MKSIHQWIEEYGKSHQNPRNKAIHWVCVPLIMLSLLSLISLIPFPIDSAKLFTTNMNLVKVNWTLLFLTFSVIFYLRLSISIAIGMLLVAVLMLASISWIEFFDPSIWRLSLTIFVLAWIGQFIGHKIEGEKPSFFEDLQFLLIGPAWLLSFIYKKLGIPL